MAKLLTGNSVMWELYSVIDWSPPQRTYRKERRSCGSIRCNMNTYQWFLIVYSSCTGLRAHTGTEKLSLLSVRTIPINHSLHSSCPSVRKSATVRCVLFPYLSHCRERDSTAHRNCPQMTTYWIPTEMIIEVIAKDHRDHNYPWQIAQLIKCLQTCTAPSASSGTGCGGVCL